MTYSLFKWTAPLALTLMMSGASFGGVIEPVALDADHGLTEPTITTQSFKITPRVDENGVQVVDENGAVIEDLVLTSETPVLPGDRVVYEFSVHNPTQEILENVAISSQFPVEMELMVDSFSGPENTIASFSTQDGPDVWYQISPILPEKDRENMPSLDDMSNLRIIVPQVPVDSKALVSYAANLRQGTSTTTTITTPTPTSGE